MQPIGEGVRKGSMPMFGVYAHVRQPRKGAGGGVSVQGSEDHATGKGRFDEEFRCIAVPDRW
jgi:hypothetical protein